MAYASNSKENRKAVLQNIKDQKERVTPYVDITVNDGNNHITSIKKYFSNEEDKQDFLYVFSEVVGVDLYEHN